MGEVMGATCLRRPIIRELQRQAQIVLAEQGDDLLQVVLVLAGDADLLVLDPWRGVRIVKLTDFEKVVLPLIDAE